MKKIVVVLTVGMIAFPLLAAENKNESAQDFKRAPAFTAQKRHEAFQKAQDEKAAHFKATEEKMTQLVKEYKKVKDYYLKLKSRIEKKSKSRLFDD